MMMMMEYSINTICDDDDDKKCKNLNFLLTDTVKKP